MTTNWAGTHTFSTDRIARPGSVEEIAAIVAAEPRIRALGTAHSFNGIADTDGLLLSTAGLPRDIVIADDRRSVRVPASLRYGDVARRLEQVGLALHNMGSLPHISVAGAVATGTHGSGNGNGVLSTAVTALEIVTAGGTVIDIDRTGPDFDGYVVALGSLGIVTALTLEVEPSYLVRQDAVKHVPWSVVLGRLEAITDAGHSVSIFTDWLGDEVAEVLVKSRVDPADHVADAPPFSLPAPLAEFADLADGVSAFAATPSGGVAGPWSERVPHFHLDAQPSAGGDEIQTEYFVDRRRGADALEAVRALGPRLAPHLHITELRTTAPDELWLSGSYGRPTLGIHFTWRKHPAEVTALIPLVEAALADFDARPHWGKVASSSADGYARPRLADFRELVAKHDPAGVFSNDFTRRVLATA